MVRIQILQVAFQPSHAVIARPHYSSNGGEASVGAALAVSDSGSGSQEALTPELLEYLGYIPGQEEVRAQYYKQTQQTPQLQTQNIAPQYQQVIYFKQSKLIIQSCTFHNIITIFFIVFFVLGGYSLCTKNQQEADEIAT